jgi:uncharacterized membrane protein
MAALSSEDRRRVWAHLMRTWDKALGRIPVDKAAFRAVVDATDDWIETNQASFNAALPQPFRGAATTAMKTDVFCRVAERRANRLRTQEDG